LTCTSGNAGKIRGIQRFACYSFVAHCFETVKSTENFTWLMHHAEQNFMLTIKMLTVASLCHRQILSGTRNKFPCQNPPVAFAFVVCFFTL